jgi:hypothetical protein
MNIRDYKINFIDFLFSRPEYKRRVTKDLYLTRCPFCGDSKTSYHTGHLYIKVEPESDSKMVYYCQKCQEHGVVNKELIVLLGGTQNIIDGVTSINKLGKSVKNNSDDKQFKYFDLKLSDVVNPAYRRKIDYIENRLDVAIDNTLQSRLKIVTSFYDFFVMNNIKKAMFPNDLMNTLERDYVGFLSVGNSHILCRDITDKYKYPWLKYPIFPESKNNNVIFSYATSIDVFSSEPITVNLAEGVMDTIGIKEYFYKDQNTVDISVCGQNYYATIKYLVSIGLIGKNVSLNFYLDNDKSFNGRDTSLPKYVKDASESLFGNVSMYLNVKGKDYGVKKNEIILNKKIIQSI